MSEYGRRVISVAVMVTSIFLAGVYIGYYVVRYKTNAGAEAISTNLASSNAENGKLERILAKLEKENASLVRRNADLAHREAAPPPPREPVRQVSLRVEQADFHLTEQMALGTARKGDGIENCIQRELTGAPDYFGLPAMKGAALKKWIGRYAHVIAIGTKYVDWRFGGEVRIARPGVVYLLEKDAQGAFFITEIANPSLLVTHKSIPIAYHGALPQLRRMPRMGQFLGMGPLPRYEYLYTGGSRAG